MNSENSVLNHDQEYNTHRAVDINNTSHEIESPASDQYATLPNNCEEIVNDIESNDRVPDYQQYAVATYTIYRY